MPRLVPSRPVFPLSSPAMRRPRGAPAHFGPPAPWSAASLPAPSPTPPARPQQHDAPASPCPVAWRSPHPAVQTCQPSPPRSSTHCALCDALSGASVSVAPRKPHCTVHAHILGTPESPHGPFGGPIAAPSPLRPRPPLHVACHGVSDGGLPGSSVAPPGTADQRLLVVLTPPMTFLIRATSATNSAAWSVKSG